LIKQVVNCEYSGTPKIKYELLIQNPNNLWLRMSKKLEDHVPEEYIEEMHGIYWI